MTPFDLEIILHYHSRVNDCEACVENVPIWPQTRDRFIIDGLLRPVPSERLRDAIYELTERGSAFVQGLCAMPLPVQVWVMPSAATGEPQGGIRVLLPTDQPQTE